jgi:hypothetical protein
MVELNTKPMKLEHNDKILAWLTLYSGLAISAVAIYYSVAGLVAIFAAAAIPIIIMGVVLEVSKLVATVWLKMNWKRAPFLIKSYLFLAIVVLMFITSMGIFGFLSKAHIEQTTASQESVAQVERLATEITRQEDIVKRAEDKIRQLQTTGSGADANIQSQIDKEQDRIDSAYKRIQPAIDEQNKIIGSQAKLYQDELDRIDTAMTTVVGYIDSGDKENYKKAQAIIGVKPDGAFGSGSTRAYTAWKDAKNIERQVLLTKIQQATNNPQARAAAAEVKRLRSTVETQIAESNKLINRLRANVGKTTNAADIDKQVDEQSTRIKEANTQLDTLTAEKYTLEGEKRKLEAEVGPIKYIAEFIYGDTSDKNMLEHAVRWVIIIIVLVFDPLAVILLLSSQYSFQWLREQAHEEKENKVEEPVVEEEPEEATIDQQAYEQERAEMIDANVPPTFDEREPLATWNETITETNPVIEEEEEEEFENASPSEKAAMQEWKHENPTDSLKHQRKLLEKRYINELPWLKNIKSEDAEEAIKWADENPETSEAVEAKEWADEKIEEVSWIENEDGLQVKKTIDGYNQNAEQSDSTLWNRIKDSKK